MKLLNPAGLWLLLGIPVLILIYLIRPHHEERPVSSTFMWKLSQRFMKRQLPMQRLRRFALFFIQLLIIASAAVMIARPAVITGKSTEYIAIIDVSASMNSEDENGVSRFEKAVEQTRKLTEHIPYGHRVTVILAGDNARYLIQSADSASRVNLALDGAVCENGGCDTDKALLLAQQMCDRGNSKVLFFTDSNCQQANNVQVVNLNEQAWNISVDAVSIYTDDNGQNYAAATLTSHHRDVDTTVGLRVDGALSTARSVTLIADVPQQVLLPVEDADFGGIFEVFVDEQDALTLDNSFSLCTGYSRVYNVLLASAQPFYLERAFLSMNNCSITIVDTLEGADLTGFDLYVFDGIYPESYPTDGSILQFGTDQLPEGLEVDQASTTPARLSKRSGSHLLYENLTMLGTTVSSYTTLRGSAQWEQVLTCAGLPVCMTYVNELGMRTTVFSFDLHHSNLPMQTDYVVLMKNILDASVFDLISAADYTVGSTVELAVLPRAQQMYVNLPDGSVKTLVPERGKCAVVPTAVGVHTAVVSTAAGGEYADFFVHIPENEVLCAEHEALSVNLTGSTADTPDAITEIWIWFAAAILLLLILEWGVYFREQY